MASYGGLTPKRHIAWSNAATVEVLDLGTLLKEHRQKLSRHGQQSTRTYKSRSGKKRFHGTRFLKQTQILGLLNSSKFILVDYLIISLPFSKDTLFMHLALHGIQTRVTILWFPS